MQKQHHYSLAIQWTGNNGSGTDEYTKYERSHTISAPNKVDIFASADAPFRGDITKYNPEELLLASLSSCHMLWFLHVCASAGVVVVDYKDNATGIMVQHENGSGEFSEVVLYPKVVVKSLEMIEKVQNLHLQAHEKCFIARSINFALRIEGVCTAL
jgi:organic hydroperoxide reductase OsmC/OhrA